MNEFLAKKTKGWYVFGASAVCALIALIAYVVRGGDIFTTVNPIAVTLAIVGIVLSALLMYKDIKPLEILPFVLFFAFLLIFGGSEIEFIGNVAYGTDGQAIDPAFVITALFSLAAVVCGMVASIMEIEA